MRILSGCLLLSLCGGAAALAQAGPLRDLLKVRQDELAGSARMAQARLAPGVERIGDLAYGADPAQRLDVYMPATSLHDAPVIVMVHGGGWKLGDKRMAAVVENKLARWVPRGFVLVSVGYRMLPQADVPTQAADVARAVAYVQDHAAQWGGDGRQLILMGHSAGAHLVSLLTSSPQLGREHGVQPWLGTIALDSAAFNVETIMRERHYGLYDEAFGADPLLWRAVSPFAQLGGAAPPLLAVCSSQRATSCDQAQAYVQKTIGFGNRAQVWPENLSHRDINAQLGLAGPYTEAVERFMRGLGPAVAERLPR